MTTALVITEAAQVISQKLADAGIAGEIVIRQYPSETIFLVTVAPGRVDEAAQLGNHLDATLQDMGIEGFVTIRAGQFAPSDRIVGRLVDGVNDPRATEVIRLISARSRTSETQPSLQYIPDAAATIATVTTARHHLVFGRRGAGKTALLVEAKRNLDGGGKLTVWINVQSYQRLPQESVFFWIVKRWVDAMAAVLASRSDTPIVATDLARLSSDLDSAIAQEEDDVMRVARLIPRVQHAARRFQDTTGKETYLFLDDFHYLPRTSQPALLDNLHGCTRDCAVWLKIAAIKHLAKWFQSSPPLGLQTGHDAELIDLDLSLQDPSRAKEFLEKVLQSYCGHAGIRSLLGLFAHEGLDRLVLASGAVPRDYLILASEAVRRAQLRPKGKLVGAQDVNRAAGDAAQAKVQELEEDLAANAGEAGKTLEGLARLRRFCLDESRSSYFRVDFADKEKSVDAYGVLTSLMDLRLMHLVNASVSDERRAGARSEVFMLDLSQFSGQRFKKNLRVLDFQGRFLTVHETGVLDSTRVGSSPNALLAILRRGPLLDLKRLQATEPAVQLALP